MKGALLPGIPRCRCRQDGPTRRGLVAAGLISFVVPCAARAGQVARAEMPAAVAGVSIPRTRIADRALQFSRSACPDYLFNHCMRTYLFGATRLRRMGLDYDAELAFAAAALHDVGLLPAFSSAQASFEIDGAGEAESIVRAAGASEPEAQVVWHAIAMHDGKWALTSRQGPEAMLVALGAAGDVDGFESGDIETSQLDEIVQAFPRLQFKRRFTELLVGHCRRKPLAQRGTWLEGLCRETVPSAWTETIEHDIAKAAFAE